MQSVLSGVAVHLWLREARHSTIAYMFLSHNAAVTGGVPGVFGPSFGLAALHLNGSDCTDVCASWGLGGFSCAGGLQFW